MRTETTATSELPPKPINLLSTFLLVLVALLLTTSSVAAQTTVITNDDIMRLVRAGLSEEIVQATIEGSESRFDLSPDAIIRLKKEGVPESIIALMLTRRQGKDRPTGARAVAPAMDPRTDRPELEKEGVYLHGEKGWIPLKTTKVSKIGSAGFGSMLSSGLFRRADDQRHTRTAEIEGAKSAFVVGRANPVFSIRLGLDQRIGSCALVRFESKKNKRKIKVVILEKETWITSPTDKHLVPTAREKVHDRLYTVRPASPLEMGEYAFWCADPETKGGWGRIYDFTVTDSAVRE